MADVRRPLVGGSVHKIVDIFWQQHSSNISLFNNIVSPPKFGILYCTWGILRFSSLGKWIFWNAKIQPLNSTILNPAKTVKRFKDITQDQSSSHIKHLYWSPPSRVLLISCRFLWKRIQFQQDRKSRTRPYTKKAGRQWACVLLFRITWLTT